ncbi:hypothetical protein [Novosphingobium sp. B1]|uniref:hypothetical protein n=1 Tax=Novosphingobium sp. B1 TaxID=1938756 RepID=UPI0009D88859|nr:hypothetical protein [Novosphingobium sp. B1]SMC82706.1 hypothetical protein SAMN06272759_1087 [Novosphingobium sp. B1]
MRKLDNGSRPTLRAKRSTEKQEFVSKDINDAWSLSDLDDEDPEKQRSASKDIDDAWNFDDLDEIDIDKQEPGMSEGRSALERLAADTYKRKLKQKTAKASAKRYRFRKASAAKAKRVASSPFQQKLRPRVSGRHFPPIDACELGERDNHLNKKAINSLWACNTLDDVETLHSKWSASFSHKCMIAVARRKLDEKYKEKVKLLLEGVATNSPNILNPAVLTLGWQHTGRSLYAIAKAHPDWEFAMITTIDGDFGTSTVAPFVDITLSHQRAQRTLRAMGGNFIGSSEIASFKSHRHADGGRHLQWHGHAITFGPNIVTKAKEVAKRHMNKFAPNFTDAPQINIRRVAATELNLARVCAYLFKQPHKTMNWVPPHDDKPGFMNQTEKGERFINYLRLAQIRSMLNIDDILFAGGECKAIKSDLIKLVRQTCKSNVPSQSRVLHPDAIPSFWNEVNKALNRNDFQVPVIGRTL